MSSIVNQLVTTVVAVLSGAPAVATQIERVRLRQIKAGATQVVVVRAEESAPSTMALGLADATVWNTPLTVECYARATPGVAPDVAVDSVASAVYARLMADPTLGGVLRWLEPTGLHYDFDADAEQTACAIFTFHARHVAGAQVFTP